MKRQTISVITVLALLLTACQIDLPSSAETEPAAPAPAVESPAVEPAVETAPSEAATETTETTETTESQAANSEAESAVVPAEQLIAAFTESSETNGELLILYGQVLDVNENPIPNAVIEIWQTDATGIYDHPGDPSTSSRDTTFQFYGMTTTDADGWYAFRTIVPGRYEPRPRHIHYKVKQNERDLLTSQFYFSDDIAEVQSEGMFRAVGESGDLLLIQLVQGDGQLLGNGQIVVDTGIGAGALPLTPSQATGPYYPVVDLVAYDNDLTRLP